MIKYIIILLFFPVALFAHEGHDKAEKAVASTTSYFSSEANSDKYELLVKYKTLPVNKEGSFQLFVTNFLTNQPVDSLQVQASVSGNGDIKLAVSKLEKGVFEIKGIFPEKKPYNISINVNSPLGADLLLVKNLDVGKELPAPVTDEAHHHWYTSNLFFILLGLLAGMAAMYFLMRRTNKKVITTTAIFLLLFPSATTNYLSAHGGEDHGENKTATAAGPSNTFIVEKETQFLFEIITQQVSIGNFNQSTEVLGTVVPSPKGMAVIQSPETGKIISIRTTVGQRVTAGQLLAVIEQQVDPGTQVSLLTQKHAVDAEYNAAKAQYDRLRGIADIVAKKDLTEAKARFETAAKNRRLFDANAAGNVRSTKLIKLTAPINGIVGTFNYAIGAVVSGGQTLFEITNLDRVFVEAQVFSNDVAKLKTIQHITATSNNPNDTTSYSLKVVSTAQQVNPENQSQLVMFELANANGRFKMGENVNVHIFSGDYSKEIIVPDNAIAEVNGKPAVFIKDRAEVYSISYINKGTSNSKIVNIIKGVEEGERVVINGVYQMKTIFLNQ